MEEVLLERGRDGGLARGRQAGQPDGEAALAAELIALAARQGRVPGDVAIDFAQSQSIMFNFSLFAIELLRYCCCDGDIVGGIVVWRGSLYVNQWRGKKAGGGKMQQFDSL